MAYPDYNKWHATTRNQLKHFYEVEGATLEQLAEANNCSVFCIRDNILKAGGTMRPRGRKSRFS